MCDIASLSTCGGCEWNNPLDDGIRGGGGMNLIWGHRINTAQGVQVV